MYESHIVFQFFREWGFSDGHAAAMNRLSGRGKTVSMLGNMQNKFDLFFGDVAITNSYRFQLIEFKQDSEGFAKEVTAAKEKRSKLYQHLSTDQVCLELSYLAHVAGYVENDVLRLDPYYLSRANCLKRITGKKQNASISMTSIPTTRSGMDLLRLSRWDWMLQDSKHTSTVCISTSRLVVKVCC